jgi:hypothetical protein
MNEILPFVEDLINRSILTTTALSESASEDAAAIVVDSVNWMRTGEELAIGDAIATVQSVDPTSGTITLAGPLGVSAPAGAPVRKIRATRGVSVYIGNYDKIIPPPAIRIYGVSLDTEPLTIGGIAYEHAVTIDVMSEGAEHSSAHRDMLATAKELFNVLIRHRSFAIGNRWMTYGKPALDYGTIKGTTYQAARVVWTFREESHLIPDPEDPYNPSAELETLEVKKQELEGLLEDIQASWPDTKPEPPPQTANVVAVTQSTDERCRWQFDRPVTITAIDAAFEVYQDHVGAWFPPIAIESVEANAVTFKYAYDAFSQWRIALATTQATPPVTQASGTITALG